MSVAVPTIPARVPAYRADCFAAGSVVVLGLAPQRPDEPRRGA